MTDKRFSKTSNDLVHYLKAHLSRVHQITDYYGGPFGADFGDDGCSIPIVNVQLDERGSFAPNMDAILVHVDL